MLPSSKRPPRNQEPSEVIRTGDYEVVHGSPSSKGRVAAQRTSDRPRVFQQPVDDEDKTLLFAGSIRTMLPPRPQTPVATPPIAKAAKTPNVNLRGLTRQSERPPSPESLRSAGRARMDSEDRTVLRPTSTLPPSMQRVVTPVPAVAAPSSPPRAPSARPPAMMPTPYMPMKPMPVTQTAPPVAFNAPGGSDVRRAAPSDPHGDPPSAVITAKTRILRSKSSMSWAVGLMALGAVVGLVTAVVARGDADAIIDATASIVDPSHATAAAHANGAVAQAAVLPSFVETSHRTTAPVGTDANPAPGACLDPAGAVTTVIASRPSSSTRRRSAARTPRGEDREPRRRRPQHGVASGASESPRPSRSPRRSARSRRPSPPPVGRPEGGRALQRLARQRHAPQLGRPHRASVEVPAKPAGNDFDSANAADALAKAQLERLPTVEPAGCPLRTRSVMRSLEA